MRETSLEFLPDTFLFVLIGNLVSHYRLLFLSFSYFIFLFRLFGTGFLCIALVCPGLFIFLKDMSRNVPELCSGQVLFLDKWSDLRKSAGGREGETQDCGGMELSAQSSPSQKAWLLQEGWLMGLL